MDFVELMGLELCFREDHINRIHGILDTVAHTYKGVRVEDISDKRI
jgi:hypothetical protein